MRLLPCTIRIPHREHEVFAVQAAEKIKGDVITFAEKEALITDAWVEDGDLILKLDEVPEKDIEIARLDKYTLLVDDIKVTANERLEEEIRHMDREGLESLKRIFGG